MGLINQDPYTTTHGLTVVNSYMSIARGSVHIEQSRDVATEYDVTAIISIWYTQSDRNANRTPIGYRTIQFTLDQAQVQTNIFQHIYNVLEVDYPNHIVVANDL